MTGIIFRSAGAGPAVLLLHAFPLDAAMWSSQMSTLDDSGMLLAPDLPGFGASGQADVTEDLDVLAKIVYEECRSRGVEDALVVGCSMGGYLAFALLRVAAQFVRGLALINTKASADTDQARANRLALADRVERDGPGFLVDEWPRSALSPLTMLQQPDIVQSVQDMIRQATARGVMAAQRAMAKRPDSTPLLGAIRVPTAVIHGSDDTIIAEVQARAMADAIAGATFVAIPAAGHLPNLEQPSAVNGVLRSLFTKG